jgi:hypothetical protein
METQKRKIDWPTSSRKFASAVWALLTYVALLGAAGWLALLTSERQPAYAALIAVFNTAWLHWMIFIFIERRPSA